MADKIDIKGTTIMKGDLSKPGGMVESITKKRFYVVNVNPSAYHYFEKEGGKYIATVKIDADDYIEMFPGKGKTWSFTLHTNIRPHEFIVESQELQLQWTQAFHKAILRAGPRTEKSVKLYTMAYALDAKMNELTASFSVLNQRYTGDGKPFVTQDMLEKSRKLFNEFAMLFKELQEAKGDKPWWKGVLNDFLNFAPQAEDKMKALSLKLDCHNLIRQYQAKLEETKRLLHCGMTENAKAAWLECAVLEKELTESGKFVEKAEAGLVGEDQAGQDILIDDVKELQREHKRHEPELEALFDSADTRDTGVRDSLKCTQFLNTLLMLDRALAIGLKGYTPAGGPGFITDTHVREANMAYNEAVIAMQSLEYAASLKMSKQIDQFIERYKGRVAGAERSLRIIEGRARAHNMFTEFDSIADRTEHLVAAGYATQAQQLWEQAEHYILWAQRLLRENAERKENNVLGDGVVVETAQFLQVAKQRDSMMKALLQIALEKQETEVRDEENMAVVLGSVERRFEVMERVCKAVVKRFGVDKSMGSKLGLGLGADRVCVYTGKFGLKPGECARAAMAVENCRQALYALEDQFSKEDAADPGGIIIVINQFKPRLIRCSADVPNMFQKLSAQEAIQKFFDLSLPIEYYWNRGHFEEAIIQVKLALDWGNGILSRSDFMDPNNPEQRIQEINDFYPLYQERYQMLQQLVGSRPPRMQTPAAQMGENTPARRRAVEGDGEPAIAIMPGQKKDAPGALALPPMFDLPKSQGQQSSETRIQQLQQQLDALAQERDQLVQAVAQAKGQLDADGRGRQIRDMQEAEAQRLKAKVQQDAYNKLQQELEMSRNEIASLKSKSFGGPGGGAYQPQPSFQPGFFQNSNPMSQPQSQPQVQQPQSMSQPDFTNSASRPSAFGASPFHTNTSNNLHSNTTATSVYGIGGDGPPVPTQIPADAHLRSTSPGRPNSALSGGPGSGAASISPGAYNAGAPGGPGYGVGPPSSFSTPSPFTNAPNPAPYNPSNSFSATPAPAPAPSGFTSSVGSSPFSSNVAPSPFGGAPGGASSGGAVANPFAAGAGAKPAPVNPFARR